MRVVGLLVFLEFRYGAKKKKRWNKDEGVGGGLLAVKRSSEGGDCGAEMKRERWGSKKKKAARFRE